MDCEKQIGEAGMEISILSSHLKSYTSVWVDWHSRGNNRNTPILLMDRKKYQIANMQVSYLVLLALNIETKLVISQ